MTLHQRLPRRERLEGQAIPTSFFSMPSTHIPWAVPSTQPSTVNNEEIHASPYHTVLLSIYLLCL